MCVYAHTQRKLTLTFSSLILDLFLTCKIYMFCIFILHMCYIYTGKDHEWMKKNIQIFLKVIDTRPKLILIYR